MQTQFKLPIFYISHSGPPSFFDKGSTHCKQLVEVRKRIDPLKKDIKCVIFVSAHYESHGATKILNLEQLSTVHDHGFSDYFEFHYSPRGETSVAKEIHQSLQRAGINSELDTKWGADHAAWMVLGVLYENPKELKLVMLSVDQSGEQNVANVGRCLEPFRSQGCLIICSGTATHSFELFRAKPSPRRDLLQKQNDEFLKWFKTTMDIQSPERTKTLLEFRKQVSYKAAHPTDDHWLPAICAAGATENLKSEKVYDGKDFGTFSMLTYMFS